MIAKHFRYSSVIPNFGKLYFAFPVADVLLQNSAGQRYAFMSYLQSMHKKHPESEKHIV